MPPLPPPVQFQLGKSSWKLFTKRTNSLFLTYSVTDPVVKKNYLLASLGDDVYNLLHSLCVPKEPEHPDYTFENLIAALTAHLRPVRSLFSARQNFYRATQSEGETVPEFSARVRQLASECEFGKELDVVCRDIFIMGLRNERVKDRLFEEDPTKADFTLQRAIEIAVAKEAVANESRASTSDFNNCQVKQEYPSCSYIRGKQRKTNFQKRSPAPQPPAKTKCIHCGWKHESRDCRFKNATCNRCMAIGHLASVCRIKPTFRSNRNQKFLAETEKEEDSDVCLGDSFFCMLTSESKPPSCPAPFRVPLNILGNTHHFEIDTGSSYNVISSDFRRRHFMNFPLFKNDIQLTDYVGRNIHPVGKVVLPVKHEKYSGDMIFYVIEKGGPPLIGRNGLLILNLDLKQNEALLHLSPNSFSEIPPKDIIDILEAHPKVFSDDTGPCSNYKVSLKLKSEAKPVFFRARTLPIALKDKVEAEITRLIKADVLEPVDHSAWGTPIVPVLKPDGSIRICGDYRITLNPQLEATGNSLPKIDHLCANFCGGTVFSKIDLANAYQQLELDDESKALTTISTHMGLFRYKRLCFGISSAPAAFQKLMDHLFRGMPGVGSLLDDIHISGRSRTEHNQRLKRVLEILDAANLRAKAGKCVFAQRAIQYLGHRIDKDGLHMTDEHVRAIRDAPPPTDQGTLKSFLGMVTFYLKFVKNAANILQPLYSLLKKNVKWAWSTVCQQSFEHIKQILISKPVLTHFDPHKPLKLTVDASSKAVGAVLSHHTRDGDKPIAYASQMLSATQQAYPSIEREAYAIVYGINRFKDFLYGRGFDLVTDHRPLLYIFESKKGLPIYAANRIQRWAYQISNFNYRLKCVRSDDNCADFLSRITWSKGAVETDPGNATTYLNYVNENSPFRLDWRSIQRETRTDVELAPVVSAIQRGDKMPSDDRFAPYKRREHELTVDKSCLMWGYRVVVPSKLRSSVLSKLHETHMGATKMKSHARSFFWWPSLDRDIESVAARCETCCKFRSTPPPSVLKPWPWPSTVWTRLHIDFFGPVNQKINYFVLEDATSKWIEAFQVPSTTASVAIEKLQEIFARFGLPRAITSDGAKCFTGTEFSEFLQLYGIVHLRGPPFHPQSNGFGESAVKIVKRSVQKALASGLKPTNLSRAVNNFLFQYRNTVHAAIMDTPAGLLLKKKPMTFFDLMIPSSESVVLERQASMVKNGGHRQVFLYPNDLVWVRDYRFGQPKWIKGHIQDVLGDQTFLVKTHDNNLWSRHLDQLWPGSPRKTAPDPNVSQPNLQSPKETSQTPNEKSQNTATSTAESSADFQGFSPPSQAIEKSPTTSTPISTPQRRTTRKIRKPLRFEPR
ncbi:Hypothetical Protein NTJ_07993 [Nesidiocoris tenuis]|uniref:RNA-directed DNA polymerase n=1 Tax=Nesidiocoris tenuis TaxID=355587 RepID=A0ABN7ASJ9_9HEMI|nr:Hypothetical Protein NTJ_07993 [Nesidiocoris tenuis]